MNDKRKNLDQHVSIGMVLWSILIVCLMLFPIVVFRLEIKIPFFYVFFKGFGIYIYYVLVLLFVYICDVIRKNN